jgi:PIN domain nuclease of toxin-antitoxin system
LSFLLDTCTFLWMLGDEERLGRKAREVIGDPVRRLYLSAASSWEIAIKVRLGKLVLPEPQVLVPAQMARNAIEALPVQHHHALATAALEPHHRDPFDRLLIAQARLERLTLLTPDPAFVPYGIKLLW